MHEQDYQQNDDIDAQAYHPCYPGSSCIITCPDTIFNSTSFKQGWCEGH